MTEWVRHGNCVCEKEFQCERTLPSTHGVLRTLVDYIPHVCANVVIYEAQNTLESASRGNGSTRETLRGRVRRFLPRQGQR